MLFALFFFLFFIQVYKLLRAFVLMDLYEVVRNLRFMHQCAPPNSSTQRGHVEFYVPLTGKYNTNVFGLE